VAHEPIGVVAVVNPWNIPFGNAVWGIMPNLIAGNTVVFKHSEHTPLCGQEIMDIFKKVGLPDGVVDVVHGDGKVGGMLIDSDVDLVWFTGSTKVGQEIYEKCVKKFIRCVLELGGSSPAIVMDDADLDNTLENIYSGRFYNCGQVCNAIKRLFVHKKIYREFVDVLVEKVSQTKVGDPFDKVDFGPLVSKKQLALLEAQVKDAIDKGAKIEIGGSRPKDPTLKDGNYYLPTILTDVNFKMRVLTEEVFGPVLPVISFNDVDQAVKMANRTEYGLSAEIYTQNLELGREIVKKLEAGSVSINSNDYLTPTCPFGGYKKSGLGREGGKYGFHELTQTKYVFENRC
jgi:acyl-CoA reductase-like NAD-dependent aldehyde dehydrogenase